MNKIQLCSDKVLEAAVRITEDHLEYGKGHGYRDVFGNGYGAGYGDGWGFGFGYGCGYSEGYGDGYGYGDGFGHVCGDG